MTTKDEISKWFDNGINFKNAYMLIYCDTFDNEDYPVYAKNVTEFWEKYYDPMRNIGNMQRLMEVYDLSLDKDIQLLEKCSMHKPIEKEENS